MSSYQESAASARSVLDEIDRLERELAQSNRDRADAFVQLSAEVRTRQEMADQFSALRLDHELLRKVSAEKLARMQAEVERKSALLRSLLHSASCRCPHACAPIIAEIGGEP